MAAGTIPRGATVLAVAGLLMSGLTAGTLAMSADGGTATLPVTVPAG